MTGSDDLLAQLIPEIQAILRRAFEAGRKMEREVARERVMRAFDEALATYPGAAAPENKHAPEPTPMAVAPTDRSVSARKYPYGTVKRTLRNILRSVVATGATRDQIRLRATLHGVVLDDDAVRNALKTMLRDREAYSTGNGIYFPGPAMAEEETGAVAAPVVS